MTLNYARIIPIYTYIMISLQLSPRDGIELKEQKNIVLCLQTNPQ